MMYTSSIAMGVGITTVVIVTVYLALGSVVDEPAPQVEISTPRDIGEIDSQTMTALLFENASPVLGDESAPVTLIEFGDYQCHFCNVFFQQTKSAILKDYVQTGKVKIIFKDYNIIGPDSVDASYGAHCAGDQDMFWKYHNALYSNWDGENTGWASYPNLKSIADEMPGLDFEEWTLCMQERPHAQRILGSNADARALGLTGTPTFFITSPGGISSMTGAKPYDVFADVFDSALVP